VRIFAIDGKKLALELDWNVLSGDNQRKAIRQLLAEEAHQGVKRGIILRNEGQEVVGLVGPLDKGSEPSAAAWLAQANRLQNEELRNANEDKVVEQNWIVIESLGPLENGEEGFWFSVIQDGLPLPGADVIINWDDLTDTLSRFLAERDFYTVYARDQRIINAFQGQGNLHARGFWEIVGDVKFRKRPRLLTGVDPKIWAGLAVFIILGLAWWGYDQYDKSRRLAESQAATSAANAQAAQAAQAAKVAYRHEVEKTIEATFAAGLADINGSLVQGDPVSTLEAWGAIIGQIPLAHAGWQMSGVQCDVNARIPECTVRLTRGSYGINRTLVQQFPEVQLDGDNAFYVIRGAQLPERDNHVQNIVGGRTLSLGLFSDLQVLRLTGIQHQIAPSSDIVKVITLPKKSGPGLPSAHKKKEAATTYQIQYGVGSGSLSLSGDQMWQFRDLAPVLESPALVIKGMTLTITPSTLATSPWTLSFAYFVRTAPYPMIPAIAEADIPGGPIDPETGHYVNAPTAPGKPARAHPTPDFTPGGVKASSISPAQPATDSGSTGAELSAPVEGLPVAR
jgi:hypothetical protein